MPIWGPDRTPIDTDVGVSVDSAVDIAKDSADIILLEKSLAVLGDGVIEGRKVFGNITKYIKTRKLEGTDPANRCCAAGGECHRRQTGQGKPVTKQIEESTDMYSFLFWQLGIKPQSLLVWGRAPSPVQAERSSAGSSPHPSSSHCAPPALCD